MKNIYIFVLNYKKVILFCLVIFFILISCKKENIHSIDTYYIDIQRDNSVSIGDFISEIKIIPLETTDFSIIRDITKIIFYQNKIFIFDLSQNIILIFNNEGKFINKIDNIGQGPNEFLNISDFAVNKNTNNICILDAIKNALFHYDLHGNLQNIENLPKLSESAYNIFQFINNEHIMFWTSDESNRLKIYDKTTKSIIMENFPRKGYPILAFLFSDSLVLTEMSNLIYSYSSNKINEFYKIEIENLNPDLRDRSLPKSYDIQSQLLFMNKLIKSENIDYLIKNIHSTSKYIIFSFYRKGVYYTYIVDKDTGLYFNFDNINKDFIPFIKYSDDDFLLGVYYPELLYIYESILDDSQFNMLENNSEDNNPVLIQYKMKQFYGKSNIDRTEAN